MKLNKLSDLFWLEKPNVFFLSIILGVIGGISYAVLIPLVIYALETPKITEFSFQIENYTMFRSPTSEMATAFVVACLIIILLKSVSHVTSIILAQRASTACRKTLYRYVADLPYITLERIGQSKIINLLHVDIPNINGAATSIPMIWTNAITVLGTLGYLLYLDKKIFLFVLICLAVAVVTHQLPIFLAMKFFTKSRDYIDDIQEGVSGLLLGAKELKLSPQKTSDYIENYLDSAEDGALKHEVRGHSFLTVAEIYGSLISFLVISVVVFHMPYQYPLSQIQLFGIVMALLYLTGPVNLILVSIADLQRGQIALTKLTNFYSVLEQENLNREYTKFSRWTEYKANGLTFSYQGGSMRNVVDGFTASFRKGEVSFIIGGNGSGKSTVSKLLSLHYIPQEGDLLFGETVINKSNLISARNRISAVYTDFHVFKDQFTSKSDELISEYIEFLELTEVVSVTSGVLSTIDLSDGQRKRLALLAILLDDREICIFDEWAADQDPHFKDKFYRVIVKRIASQGKVVIIVSHDDRYFDCADMIYKVDYGKVVEERSI